MLVDGFYSLSTDTHLMVSNFPGDSVVENPPVNAGSVSRSGRSPGEGNGNPLQYSCPGNPMDRGVWQGHKELDTTW